MLTDGVVAIAMTLLVLDIRLPESAADASNSALWDELWDIREQLFSYAFSVVVIALLWLTHAQKFRGLTRFTGTLFWLNTLFLLAVGLVPFAASLLASNGNGTATAVYAIVMAVASLALSLMWLHATTSGLASEHGVKVRASIRFAVHFMSAAVFLASIAISFWSPSAARYFWLLLIPVAVFGGRLERAAGLEPDSASD